MLSCHVSCCLVLSGFVLWFILSCLVAILSCLSCGCLVLVVVFESDGSVITIIVQKSNKVRGSRCSFVSLFVSLSPNV